MTNHFEGLKRADRARGGEDANPRLAERKGLAHRRADAEAAQKTARAQAAGKATRSERWASPPAESKSKGPRDPETFAREVLDPILKKGR